MNSKLTYFLLLSLGLLFVACGGDDDDNTPENSDPSFSFSIDWDEDFLNTDGIAGMDLPTEFDASWDEETDFSQYLDGDDEVGEGAFYALDTTESAPYNFLFASDVQGQDTVFMNFQIFSEELTTKRYEFASGNLLESIFEDLFGGNGEEIPEGVVVPGFFFTGDIGEQIAFISFFGLGEYEDSYLEITDINEETKAISGNFKMNWSVTSENEETGEDEVIKILSIDNSSFNKVQMVQ